MKIVYHTNDNTNRISKKKTQRTRQIKSNSNDTNRISKKKTQSNSKQVCYDFMLLLFSIPHMFTTCVGGLQNHNPARLQIRTRQRYVSSLV